MMTNNTPLPTPEKVTLPAPELQRRDTVFLVLTLLFSLAMTDGVYVGGLRLGFATGALALLVTALLYLRKNMRVTALGMLCFVSSAVITVSFAVHEGTAFAPFKFLFLLLTVSVFAVSAYGIKAPSLDDFRALLSPFYLFFGGSCGGLGATTGALAANSGGKLKKVGKALFALGISLPLLLLLTVLLASADRAFEGFMDSIDFDITGLLYTVIFGCLTALFLFSLLFAIRKDRVKLQASARKPYLAAFDPISINTVLAAITVLYLVYLVTQLSYFVGSFAGLLPEDYTYADYARRGFFEICVISAINLCILLTAELFIKRNEKEKLPASTRGFAVFISGFSLFLLTTAIAKMLMYIRTYGLTFLRLGTSLFMLLLFVVFTAMILKTFIKGFKAMRVILAAACVLMTLTAAVEPYNVIAGYNLYAYNAGWHERIDVQYLANACGAYGVHALIELAEDENADVAFKAEEKLDNMHNRYYYRVDAKDLREMTLVRYRAREALAEYYAE